MIHAFAPLTVRELQHALVAGDLRGHQDSFDDDELEDFDENLLLSICAGMVVVDEESRVIRLVHYTTREYLLRKQTLLGANDPPTILAQTCIRYLTMSTLAGIMGDLEAVSYLYVIHDDSEAERNSQEIASCLEKHALLAYSAKYWTGHIRDVREALAIDITEAALELLLNEESSFLAVNIPSQRLLNAEILPPLIAAASLNLPSVVNCSYSKDLTLMK